MLTKTAQNWKHEYATAIETLKTTKNACRNNNNANDIRNYNIVIALLDSVPDTLEIEVDGVAANRKQSAYEIGNLGEIGECIVRYHLMKRKPQHITKRASGKDDFDGWEIKTALSCRWQATQSPNRKTILVNKCGIFKLTGKEIPCEVDNYYRLPYKKEIGYTDETTETLETLLGLWD